MYVKLICAYSLKKFQSLRAFFSLSGCKAGISNFSTKAPKLSSHIFNDLFFRPTPPRVKRFSQMNDPLGKFSSNGRQTNTEYFFSGRKANSP